MKKGIIITILCSISFVSSMAQTWHNVLLLGGNIEPSSLHIENDGEDVLVTGEFNLAQLKFGNKVVKGQGGRDIFLARISKELIVKSLIGFGGSGDEFVCAIATDERRNIYLSGFYEDSIAFGEWKLRSIGGIDAFVVMLDSNLNVTWAKSFGSELDDDKYIALGGLDLDKKGNVFVAGDFSDVYTNRPLIVDDSIFPGFGKHGNFLIKFNNTGVAQAVAIFGTKQSMSSVTDVEVSVDSCIMLPINPGAPIQFKSDKYSNPYIGSASFLFKLTEDLDSILWAFPFYTMEFGTIDIRSIAQDSKGSTYVAGGYACEAIQIGDGTKRIRNPFMERGSEFFVAKIDKNGKLVWVYNGGGNANDFASEIEVLTDNKIALTGSYTEQCFYNGDTIGALGKRGVMGFALQIDSMGKPTHFSSIGETSTIQMLAINALDSSSVVVGGKIISKGTLLLDSLPETYVYENNTLFLAKGVLNKITKKTITEPLSHKTIEQNLDMVYPNPFTNQINLKISTHNEGAVYRIYDVTGKLYVKDRISLHSQQINTESWLSGVYFLEIVDTLGSTYQTKLIKK